MGIAAAINTVLGFRFSVKNHKIYQQCPVRKLHVFPFLPEPMAWEVAGVRDYNKCGTAAPGCSCTGWKACATKKFSNASKGISLL
jgi:hypothetical protein